MWVSKCKNEDCKKKQDCARYNEAQGELINFKAICFDINAYKWFMSRNLDVVLKEEEVKEEIEEEIKE
jgi:hypothetical protein